MLETLVLKVEMNSVNVLSYKHLIIITSDFFISFDHIIMTNGFGLKDLQH